MSDVSKIGAAVIGTGFIGTVHIQALRRLGVKVTGVLGSSPERSASRAGDLGVGKSYRSLDELLKDPRSSSRPCYVAQPSAFRAGETDPCSRPPCGLREALGDDFR